MSLPNYQEFVRPPLIELQDGQAVKFKDICSRVLNLIGLAEQQLQQRTPSGKQTYAYHRLRWAKTYLVKACFIEQFERGFCKIMHRGIQSNIDINNDFYFNLLSFTLLKMQLNKNRASSKKTSKPVQVSSLNIANPL